MDKGWGCYGTVGGAAEGKLGVPEGTEVGGFCCGAFGAFGALDQEIAGTPQGDGAGFHPETDRPEIGTQTAKEYGGDEDVGGDVVDGL